MTDAIKCGRECMAMGFAYTYLYQEAECSSDFLHFFLSPMCMCVQYVFLLWACAYGGMKLMHKVFFDHYLDYILRQGVSVESRAC